jgi:hypothetical protein
MNFFQQAKKMNKEQIVERSVARMPDRITNAGNQKITGIYILVTKSLTKQVLQIFSCKILYKACIVGY